MYGYRLCFCAAVHQMYITCIRWEGWLLSYNNLFERRLNVLWMFYTQLVPSWKWNFEVYEIFSFHNLTSVITFDVCHMTIYIVIYLDFFPNSARFHWFLRATWHLTIKLFPAKSLWPDAITKCVTSEGKYTLANDRRFHIGSVSATLYEKSLIYLMVLLKPVKFFFFFLNLEKHLDFWFTN